jgi:hypothetical protein
MGMSVTRREFLTHTVLATGAIAGTSVSVRWLSASNPALAFFDGQLWLDSSGQSPQYVAPAGARGAAHLANLTEDDLHTLYGRI